MTDESLAEGCRLAHEQIQDAVMIMLGAWQKLPRANNHKQNLYEAIKQASAADLHFLFLSQTIGKGAK